MTDFGIVYRDPSGTINFSGEGVWESDVCVGFQIRWEEDLSRMDPEDARTIWERVRQYVLEQDHMRRMHPNVLVRPFAEVWVERKKLGKARSGPA